MRTLARLALSVRGPGDDEETPIGDPDEDWEGEDDEEEDDEEDPLQVTPGHPAEAGLRRRARRSTSLKIPSTMATTTMMHTE